MSNMAVGRVVTVGLRRWRELAYNRFGDFLRTLARNFPVRARGFPAAPSLRPEIKAVFN